MQSGRAEGVAEGGSRRYHIFHAAQHGFRITFFHHLDRLAMVAFNSRLIG